MLKKVWNVVTAILVGVMVLLAILLVGVRVAGVQPYTVLSGSMSPTYPVGALIYVKPAQPQEVRIGDPITFHLEGTTVVATHRVIRIDSELGYFYTKGDANESPDGQPVTYDRLVGIPVFSIPLLGYFSNFITTPPGLFIAIAAVLMIVVLTFLPGLLAKTDGNQGAASSGSTEDAKTQKQRKAARTAVHVN